MLAHCEHVRTADKDHGQATAHNIGKGDSDEQGTNKAFNRLFRTQFNELMTSKEHATTICCDIVHDD